ncbi:hypothetical protein BKA04_001027 [Cryobacterium mesophilum]|uniref:Uncharacterized protein n=1 Tax=Terrimesophilobacter mesophilus TaxID=433647 RepID=A0A4R8VC23_9MICO|nr:hypothetical protein [Terrimesophilobacter mesophilus]MBB5632804.1 hypothetical protein [Terrimesophilobacter mesophilus]TFB79592.1 hypothetical protein E3N84_05760 [Terrimesophilobacter mesophilus]
MPVILSAADAPIDGFGWTDAITGPAIVAAVIAFLSFFITHWIRSRVVRRNAGNAAGARAEWEKPERRPGTPEPLVFPIGPFPRTVKSIAGLRSAFSQPYPAPRYSVRRPPAVVVDLEAVTIHDGLVGTILRIPAGRIVSLDVRKRWIWPRFSIIPIRPWSLVLQVVSGGDEQALVLTPVPSGEQEIGRGETERIAAGMIERLRIVRGAS